MKKYLTLIILCSLCLGFAACGDDKKEEIEQFVWAGDWNDPNDPAYKPEYEGKYNPIQGLWRSTKNNTIGLYFSKDIKFESVTFSPTSDRYVIEGKGAHYKINDKAFRYNYNSTWLYKIDGNRMFLRSYVHSIEEGVYFVKVQER